MDRYLLIFSVFVLRGVNTRPKPQINNNGDRESQVITVNITEVDRRNIGLAETVGVNSLDIAYPQGIACVLRKVGSSSPGGRCRQVVVPRCRTIQKIRLTNVTEDCGKKAEYCQYSKRRKESPAVTKETIICERSRDLTCETEQCVDCPNICHRNHIVVCATEHQKVIITERKLKCGKEKKLEAVKICYTYPDASWVCKELRNTEDCDPKTVRIVSSEITIPRIMCSKKEQSPICIPGNCRLTSNDTHCLRTHLPLEVDLEDFECEECSHGRTKERQVLVQEEECQDVTQELCVDNEERASEWIKTCTVSTNTQPDIIAQIIEENAKVIDDTNDLQAGGVDKSNVILFHGPVRDEYINVKPTNNMVDSHDAVTNMIEGADIFFAKQFFKNAFLQNTKGQDRDENISMFTTPEPTPLTTRKTTKRTTIKVLQHFTTTQAKFTEDTTPKPIPITTGSTATIITSTKRNIPRPTTTKSSTSFTILTTPKPTLGTTHTKSTVDPKRTTDQIFIPQITSKRTTILKTTTPKRTTTARNVENELINPNILVTENYNYSNEKESTSCLESQECPSDEQCISGTCQLTCQNSDSCPSGESCINSKCVNHCSNQEACGVNAQCISHNMVTYCSCIPGFVGIPTPKEGCVRSQHSCAIIPCPVGYRCESKKCHYQCQENLDCAVGERCSDGRCAKICRGDEHCLIGEICTSDLVCKAGCNGDQNCHVNQLCLNKQCATIGKEDVERDGVTRFSDRPTVRFTPAIITTTHNPANVNEEIGSGSGIYTEPTLPFPWSINDQLTTEGTPGSNNEDELNPDIETCSNVKCPVGYRCNKGKCINERNFSGRELNPESEATEDDTDNKGSYNGQNSDGKIKEHCRNVKCPVNYRCYKGECFNIGSNNGKNSGANTKQHCRNMKCAIGYRCYQGECLDGDKSNAEETSFEDDQNVDFDININSFSKEDIDTEHTHNAGTSDQHSHHSHSGQHLNHGLHRHKTRFDRKQNTGGNLNDLLFLLEDDITENDEEGNNFETSITTSNNGENSIKNTNTRQPNEHLQNGKIHDRQNIQNNIAKQQTNGGNQQNLANNFENKQNGLLFFPFTDPLLRRTSTEINQQRGNQGTNLGNIRNSNNKKITDKHTSPPKEDIENLISAENVSEIDDEYENNDKYNRDTPEILNSESDGKNFNSATIDMESKANLNHNNQETNIEHGNNLFQDYESYDSVGSDYKQRNTQDKEKNNRNSQKRSDKMNQMQKLNGKEIANIEEDINKNNRNINNSSNLLFHPLTDTYLTRTSTDNESINKQKIEINESNNREDRQPVETDKNGQQHGQNDNHLIHPLLKHNITDGQDQNRNNMQQGNFNFGTHQDGIHIISEGKFEINRELPEETSGSENTAFEDPNTGIKMDHRDQDCQHITNENERITCKVISCFKHKDNCF